MDPSRRASLLERLQRVYVAMDAAYAQAAAAYGFVCNGCEDTCCRTRFHHHTLIEYLGLREGLRRLPADRQAEIRERSAAVAEQQAQDLAAGADSKPLCPLNTAGRCELYAHRPMICRLHGIPHELHPPGQSPQLGPGCAEFHRRCGRSAYHAFDRTGLYTDLARLEAQCRQAAGRWRKIRLTIAEMLLDDEAGA
jgi:Fe-S-cluster containining protein